MPAPIKLEIDEDGEIRESKEFIEATNREDAEAEAKAFKEDPENFIHKCFHGKKCEYVKIESIDFPLMSCKKVEKQISTLKACPIGHWEWPSAEKKRIMSDTDWYRRNRRLHYGHCAEQWKKRYGSTRKLPDYIVNGMR